MVPQEAVAEHGRAELPSPALHGAVVVRPPQVVQRSQHGRRVRSPVANSVILGLNPNTSQVSDLCEFVRHGGASLAAGDALFRVKTLTS